MLNPCAYFIAIVSPCWFPGSCWDELSLQEMNAIKMIMNVNRFTNVIWSPKVRLFKFLKDLPNLIVYFRREILV